MKRLVVGGNFGDPKSSSVIKKLSRWLVADSFNGGTLENLSQARKAVVDYDLVVWMPNVSNDVKKEYPRKKTGSVLICSKVLHDGRNTGDAVARIFKMNANAVITINTGSEDSFTFNLVDALGNLWIETTDIHELSSSIEALAYWTKQSKRKNSKYTDKNFFENKEVEDKFCEIVKTISQKVENERGGRYFGNASTRCSFMFPTSKLNSGLPHFPGGNVFIHVSGRNMPKDHLKPDDFVPVYEIDGEILYEKETVKPSVDAPVQLELYKKFPNINFMIHGHAYIKGAKMTSHYYPCGDLREVDSIMEVLETEQALKTSGLNLKNHGFIIFAEDLESLEKYVKETEFEYRQLEEKI